MNRRPHIVAGMIGGLIWTGLVIFLGGLLTDFYVQDVHHFTAFGLATLGPALVLALMIGRLAARRFFDPALIDGQPFPPGTAAAIDQQILSNTVEQTVLAICVWSFALLCFGGGMIVAFSIGFAVARLFFWIGYHMAPPLRAFGFAASFYPTLILAAWSALELFL